MDEEADIKEETTNTPSAEPEKAKGGSGPMIVVGAIVVLVVLGLIYYFVTKKGGSNYSTDNTANNAPSTQSAVNNAPITNIYTEKTDPAKGAYLADFAGMTLYIFDKDTKGVSNCSGTCATLWPAYSSGATAESMLPTNISVITRTDGAKQFAWKDMPLYYYSKDLKAGDINGDGVGGVWHIVKP